MFPVQLEKFVQLCWRMAEEVTNKCWEKIVLLGTVYTAHICRKFICTVCVPPKVFIEAVQTCLRLFFLLDQGFYCFPVR